MRHGKHGTRLIGLVFLAVLGLMAFGAVVIRAALPGESTSGKFELAEPVISGAEVLAKPEGTTELSISALKIKFKCTSGHAVGRFVTLSEALVTATFNGCKVFSTASEEEISSCHILNGTEKETIVATATLLPILHGGGVFVLAEPDSPSSMFAQVVFEKGTGCPLATLVKVTGSVTAQAPSAAEVKPLIASSEAIQKLTGDKLFYGVNEAFLNGSAIAELTGIHSGYAFSVL